MKQKKMECMSCGKPVEFQYKSPSLGVWVCGEKCKETVIQKRKADAERVATRKAKLEEAE